MDLTFILLHADVQFFQHHELCFPEELLVIGANGQGKNESRKKPMKVLLK
jgi:hypothetical protein